MHRKAINHLSKSDPVLADVIRAVGPCRITVHDEGDHLGALIRSIIYQQLSGKAAATIHGRVLGIFGDRVPAPDELLATPDATLRSAGLSRQKIAYLKDLALKSADGSLPLQRVHEMQDDEIEQALASVKGIGRWTAQMFLMFRLGRPDVLPESDLGIRKAVQQAYNLRSMPTPARVKEIGASWSPHATVASWYLWRLLEVPDGKRPVRKRRTVGASKKRGTIKKTVRKRRKA